jgi:hypothetical protein
MHLYRLHGMTPRDYCLRFEPRADVVVRDCSIFCRHLALTLVAALCAFAAHSACVPRTGCGRLLAHDRCGIPASRAFTAAQSSNSYDSPLPLSARSASAGLIACEDELENWFEAREGPPEEHHTGCALPEVPEFAGAAWTLAAATPPGASPVQLLCRYRC